MPFTPLPVASIVLRVADSTRRAAKLEAAGVELLGEVIDSGVCRVRRFTDPTATASCSITATPPTPTGRTP